MGQAQWWLVVACTGNRNSMHSSFIWPSQMVPIDIARIYLMFICLYTQLCGRLLMRILSMGALNPEINQRGKFLLGSMEAINSQWFDFFFFFHGFTPLC
jgi:hypothetical protein